MEQQIRLISSAFGMTGFAVALIAGVLANNPATTVLIHGILALIACRIVGVIAGEVLSHVVQQHIDHYRSSHPIPALLTSNPDAIAEETAIVVDEEVIPSPQETQEKS